MHAPWALLRGGSRTGSPAGALAGGAPWWRFSGAASVLRADRPTDVPALLAAVDAATRDGLWAVGFVAYEAAAGFDPALRTRPLPPGVPAAWFGLFPAPEPAPPPAPSPAHPGAPAAPVSLGTSLSEADYLDRLAAIRRAIARGDTYQANFTYRLRGALEATAGAGDPAFELFARLCSTQSSPYAAFLDLGTAAVCSASPELFFEGDGRRLVCRPMKGTAPRGRTEEEDLRLAAALRASAKERAENVMVVDMVRNDLGRIARPGTVRVPRLFEVERYETVFQMTSRVEAACRAPLPEVFAALFPCASITGAPKVRTMEILAELEDSPRGVYTGAVGWVAPGGAARFSVAIRTAWIDRLPARDRAPGPSAPRIEYGTGGGVVWDSVPERELAESRTKALALRRALEPPRPPFRLLETLLWTPRRGLVLRERHLERLAGSGRYFDVSLDLDAARRRLGSAVRRLPPRRHRVRLLCARGGGIEVEATPLDPVPRPCRVVLAQEPVDSADAFLFHKTTRREVYERALSAAGAVDDVLLWNERGELTESTRANLVLLLDGRLLTPPVASGLLPGTLRAELLARGRIRERILTRDDLARAERIYLVSSVRGWMPARLAEAATAAGKNLPVPAVGAEVEHALP